MILGLEEKLGKITDLLISKLTQFSLSYRSTDFICSRFSIFGSKIVNSRAKTIELRLYNQLEYVKTGLQKIDNELRLNLPSTPIILLSESPFLG